jgi:PPK2 family polyphosphate:nucleotide phosphotransferase
MAIDVAPFRVREGRAANLKKRPTRVEALYTSNDNYDALLEKRVKLLGERQELLYAHNRYAVLVILQAMDAAGKDGVIKHVMSGINPLGCQVFSFKQPSAEELEHDFLWRAAKRLPERGRIGVFNRSYYEEVLVVRVNPEFLDGQHLPDESRRDNLWKRRYESILDFERHLHRNGTRVVKFFLHLSKDEQRKRFLARIDDPGKNWKFGATDLADRGRWNDYMRAYEQCLTATSTNDAPWHVVPADDKKNARLIVSQVLLDTMKGLKMRFPETSPAKVKELRAIRRKLSSPRT